MKIKIKLSTIKDVRDFIEIMTLNEIKATASQGRYVVDARSIMGLFALDLMSPIELHLEAGDCSVLERFAA